MMKRKDKALMAPWTERRLHLRQKASRLAIHALALIGLAVLYYIGFSLLFDTPIEYFTKRSNAMLERQYKELNARLDSLNTVLGDVVNRDRNVFRMLFEADPYDFDAEYEKSRLGTYENILSMSNKQLGNMFLSRLSDFTEKVAEITATEQQILDRVGQLGSRLNNIPSIQPVVNNDLTLLTASYGMRIQPFDKHLTSHQGVDFTVPEGARVFATADGVVLEAAERSTSSGYYVIIDHGNGFRSEYRHLSRVNVSKGTHVKRGDIIALSGNTGLSFAPHLHYEVQYKGMRVDPVHYFFMELDPAEYQKMMRIAQTGMQSLD